MAPRRESLIGLYRAVSIVMAVSCAACGDTQRTSEDARQFANVAATVDDLLRPETGAQGLAILAELDETAIPFLVGRLGDHRQLPVQTMSLRNKKPNSFEAIRHIHVNTVDDALTESLEQITGKSMGAGSWRPWCVTEYPHKARFCNGENP